METQVSQTPKTHNACVYWVRLPEHTDMFSEGYVGVTRKGLDERFKGHIKKASLGYKGLFSKAIRKYQDRLIKSIILIGTEDYCYEIEEKLRPSSYIGWNSARGGMRSGWESFQGDAFKREVWIQKLRDANLGKKAPEGSRQNYSAAAKEKWNNPVFVKRMREITQERRVVKEPHRPRFWSKSGKSILIEFADVLYDIYKENPAIYCREMVAKLGFSGQEYVRSAAKLSQKFYSGWNPHEDIWWQVDFKGLDERYVPPYLFFEEAWLFYNTNPSNWLAADEIYSEIILKGGSNKLVADSLCVPVSFIKVLKKRLKRGWIPNEDPRWVKWRDEQLSLTEDTA